jgi:hypothetical protein
MLKIMTKIAVGAAVVVLVSVGGFFLWRHVTTNRTIAQLLAENEQLRTGIANLTQERQIGYAKALSQETREGKLYTKLLFVEVDPSDFTRQILRKEYEIEGDVIHFDLLMVTFGTELVKDGRERAMYLWRRVYGETMPPGEGFAIETAGEPSPRYADLTAKLSLDDSKLFWDEIWSLSNDPRRLEKLGIRAVYGNAVYRQIKPGLIYVFKISAAGTLHPEIIPDL